MNNFLRGGRGLPIAYSLWPKAFIIIFCVLFSCLTVLPVIGQEAVGLNEVRSLKVGDQIPDELWDMPLKVVNHPEGKEYVKLGDHREKELIILDFWATWCGSCLNSIRTISDISIDNPTVAMIPVTRQTSKEMDSARSLKYWFKEGKPASIVNGDFLADTFNSLSVPHLVWIHNGQIKAITNSLALTQDNIDSALSGNWCEIKQKESDTTVIISFTDRR